MDPLGSGGSGYGRVVGLWGCGGGGGTQSDVSSWGLFRNHSVPGAFILGAEREKGRRHQWAVGPVKVTSYSRPHTSSFGPLI